MIVLEVAHISKSYGPVKALDGFSLQIESGQVYGILGPNGSGKTTLLGIISGILSPDNGQYRWFEGEYKLPNLRIGTLLETPNFYPYLNADDNLDIVRQIKGVAPMSFDELLDMVKLTDRRRSVFRTYSLGMKQRLAIAGTLVGDPDVLIFDEPTNGLDPEGIAEVRSILTDIAATGKTVIMASHILNEVEKVCSHVAIIKKGNLLANGPVGMILGNADIFELRADDMGALRSWCGEQDYIHELHEKHEWLELEVDPEIATETMIRSISQRGILLTHIVRKKRSLEDEFLEITNKHENQ